MDQFLDSETGKKHQFLDPETDTFCQFLFWFQKLTLWISFWVQKLTLWARGTLWILKKTKLFFLSLNVGTWKKTRLFSYGFPCRDETKTISESQYWDKTKTFHLRLNYLVSMWIFPQKYKTLLHCHWKGGEWQVKRL